MMAVVVALDGCLDDILDLPLETAEHQRDTAIAEAGDEVADHIDARGVEIINAAGLDQDMGQLGIVPFQLQQGVLEAAMADDRPVRACDARFSAERENEPPTGMEWQKAAATLARPCAISSLFSFQGWRVLMAITLNCALPYLTRNQVKGGMVEQ